MLYFILGYRLVAAEIDEKQRCGYNFTEGDLTMNAANLQIIMALAFFGSLFAAFSGIGPGLVFGSGLAIIGLDPQVAVATGMYLTTLMTLSSSI